MFCFLICFVLVTGAIMHVICVLLWKYLYFCTLKQLVILDCYYYFLYSSAFQKINIFFFLFDCLFFLGFFVCLFCFCFFFRLPFLIPNLSTFKTSYHVCNFVPQPSKRTSATGSKENKRKPTWLQLLC